MAQGGCEEEGGGSNLFVASAFAPEMDSLESRVAVWDGDGFLAAMETDGFGDREGSQRLNLLLRLPRGDWWEGLDWGEWWDRLGI